MQLNSQEILFFVKIAAFSSFSDAAFCLDIPQPTISRKILDLEAKLNQKLFRRSRRGITLTEFGTKFLQMSDTLQHDLDNLKALATGLNQWNKTVVVEALQPLSHLLICDFLPHFRSLHPDIVVDVRTMSHHQQGQRIDDNLRLQTHTFDHSLYTFINYMSASRGFYVHPNMISTLSDFNSPQDIISTHLPCISVRQPGNEPVRWQYWRDENMRELSIRPLLLVDDALKAREAVVNELGVSWNFDVLMRKAVRNGEAKELFNSHYSGQEHAYIAFSNTKVLSEHEQHFISALRSYYHEQVPERLN